MNLSHVQVYGIACERDFTGEKKIAGYHLLRRDNLTSVCRSYEEVQEEISRDPEREVHIVVFPKKEHYDEFLRVSKGQHVTDDFQFVDGLHPHGSAEMHPGSVGMINLNVIPNEERQGIYDKFKQGVRAGMPLFGLRFAQSHYKTGKGQGFITRSHIDKYGYYKWRELGFSQVIGLIEKITAGFFLNKHMAEGNYEKMKQEVIDACKAKSVSFTETDEGLLVHPSQLYVQTPA